MSGGLQDASGGGIAAPLCAHCSREAVGPCAGCRRMVCGECCTLTEGGTRVWAVCLDCDRKKGRSLSRPWRGFGLWLLGLLAVMAIVVVLVEYLFT